MPNRTDDNEASAPSDAEAASLIADFGHQLARLNCLGSTFGDDRRMRADWRAVSDAHARRRAVLAEPVFYWQLFWATDGALFGFAEGGLAGLELLYRCLEYAPGMVIGAAVGTYPTAHCDN